MPFPVAEFYLESHHEFKFIYEFMVKSMVKSSSGIILFQVLWDTIYKCKNNFILSSILM